MALLRWFVNSLIVMFETGDIIWLALFIAALVATVVFKSSD